MGYEHPEHPRPMQRVNGMHGTSVRLPNTMTRAKQTSKCSAHCIPRACAQAASFDSPIMHAWHDLFGGHWRTLLRACGYGGACTQRAVTATGGCPPAPAANSL